MKYNIFFFFVLIITLFNATRALIRNTYNSKALTADQNNDQNNAQNVSQNNSLNNENSCAIQKMAEEMIEKLLNEKDLFTTIMEALQSRLNDDYLCTEQKFTNICIHEKDQKALTFPCSSSKYEALIHKFTYRKLCHSKIAFSNILLKSFIEKKESENTFSTILKHYNLLLKCVDNDLKEIYRSSIQLFTDLRTSVVDLSEKLWSKKIIDVLKKREHLIAGIFCELRNGSQSNLVSNSLEFENFGILKINNEDILNEAFYAFSEYYYYFPYFATKLLEKGGMIERLINIHEKLTSYRTQHILTRINEQSKTEVLNNEDVFHNLSSYKHHHANSSNSFAQFKEIKETNSETNDNINTNTNATVNTNSNTNVNTNTNANTNTNSDSHSNPNPNPNHNSDTIANPNSDTNTNPNSDTNTNPNSDTNTNPNSDTKTNPNSDTITNPNSDTKTNPTSDTITNPNSDTVINIKENQPQISNTNNNIVITKPQELSNTPENSKNTKSQGNVLNNPLYSISSLKSKNIVDLIKDLIKDTNIVKFENNEPTNNIDEEGIKKLIENSFLDLNDNTMLVRLLIKPQAVILSVIQSFILMTPSPERDARTYCKKVLVNDELIDSADIKDVSEEEDLVNKFASKYNLVYEKIKLEELREIEQSKKTIKNSKKHLSAIEVQNVQNRNEKSMAVNKYDSNNNAPLIAVVRDPNGEKTDDIINNNVDLYSLSGDVDQTFEDPNKKSGTSSMVLSNILFLLFFFFYYFI
ncbi:GPI-anchored micronemal antigen, putative [Plasmodium gallinaceum]|uniref:GPI-anchored micronemal antigen, putative n=1 Tax=Plasmodium gallinaceum TaxID=5849 RepID=A0A1J1GR48_PLAGA|nr:GPI-anchored micronemal antigen, putative [Plasmodium gallinaceum]CRG93514.1 GPI-anchored micronemal antigen, putative [Plasmodium gallinaceum]